MKTKDILEYMQKEISELEVKLYNHPYSQSNRDGVDYEILNGEKVWKEEYLEEMPSDFATMLGRFGTLQEIHDILQKERVNSLLKSDLEHFLNSSNPRFQIEFDNQ